ncbi:uncharacterized protein [Diadema setosum]|uniref:uncharacterized protein n=1 Tax=Diadema setosum TaxID=31175 RepID=UPI003B3A651E
MALVDSKYQFLWIDVGGVGHQSDAQIYNNSELKECIDAGTLGIPDPAPLPHNDDDHPMPYFFVGDDAFAMRTYMMKPYGRRNLDQQQKIFNYRLSRARRVVENAFGILALRFQCFLGQMRQEPDTVRLLVEAAIMLHNLIRKRYQALDVRMLDQEDAQHNLIPGAWRTAAITVRKSCDAVMLS